MKTNKMQPREFETILVQKENIDFTNLAEILAERIRKGALNNDSGRKAQKAC